MSSEILGGAENTLKGNLGGAWDIKHGYADAYTDLGVARRFGGAATAYSLRDIGAMNGRVVKARRDVGETSDPEEDFSASQVQSGALEDYINGKLENTLPADVATAAAAYSLRKVKASYSGDAVRIRRSSDDVEVDVAFDSDDKVSASSAITNVAEQGGEIGSTTATDLNGFLNETLTVGVAVEGGNGADRPDSFTNATNSSFTATVTEVAGGYFPYKTGAGDVITISFDLVLSGAASPSACTATHVSTVNNASNSILYTASGSYTSSFTCTVDATHFRFADGDDGTFAVTNFQVTSHTHSAFVHTWYDQAGSNNAVQETAANQPKIAESGALLDGIKFSSASDGTSANHLDIAAKLMDSTDGFMSSVINSVQDMNQLGVIYGNRNNNSGFVFGIHQAEYPQVFYRQSSGANRLENSNFTLSSSRKYLLSVDKDGTNDANLFGNAVSKDTDSSMNYITSTGSTSKIGQGGNTVTSDANGLNANINELIFYNSDQAANRFKIESNINNYYGLYNDANDLSAAFDSNGTITNESKDGFTADVATFSHYVNATFNDSVATGETIYVSFNAQLAPNGGTSASPILRLQDAQVGSNTSNQSSISEGFNSIDLTATGTSDRVGFLEQDDNVDYIISNFKVSRIARNGFVETWYDQSSNGRDMIQATAGNQPSIVSNGGYMGGVYSAPASNSTTNSNKQYMRITGTNSFASNDLTTTKVGMVAIVNSLESGTASGVSIYTVLGNIRGVQSFPVGALGLQISGTNNSQFTNYTATDAENKDELISTRTVGENTLIGGTMDNRNIKTFTFTEQGSNTDTTTASTDIVLTSQKDFGIFYSTFANDSGGEDLNVLRTAGGYMKEAYILDGDIIDDIDSINLELRQHYNLA